MLRMSVLASAIFGLLLVGCEREEGPREGPGTAPPKQDQPPPQAERDQVPLPDKTVEILSEHQFKPAEITVLVGQAIVWKNNGDEAHTVTCDPEKVDQKELVALPEGASTFDSGDIKPGDVFRFSFTVPGTYKYVCINHEEHGMAGTILVQPKTETPGKTPERP